MPPAGQSALGDSVRLMQVDAALRAELLGSVARAARLALRLQNLGEALSGMTGEILGHASSDELTRHAAGVQAVAARGLGALAELQAEAGRWEGVAALRRVVSAMLDDERGEA
jgi:hypothetical protein